MKEIRQKEYGFSSKLLWPCGRSGHRVAALGNYFYVYGGYTPENHRLFKQVWRYDFVSGTWATKSPEGCPVHVASSSTAQIGKFLVVFGGTAFPFGGNNSNELHVVDLLTGEIIKQDTSGDIPDGSYGHGCAIDEVNKKFYVVGGTTGHAFSNDVYCLDLTTKVWQLLKCKNAPMQPRYRHEVAFYDNKLYVFGGGTIENSFRLSEISFFDLTTNCWESVTSTEGDVGGVGCYKFPKGRKCHSGILVPATELSDARYIISGGVKGFSTQLDDIWSINLRTMQWSKFQSKLPDVVHFHDAALTSSGKMVVFGGLTKDDEGGETRNNYLAVYNVFVAQLQEIAWEAVVKHYPHVAELSTAVLRTVGVPAKFVERMSSSSLFV